MAILIQATCLMLLLGMVYSWPFPVIIGRSLPVAYIHSSIEEDSSPSSIFDEINRMMAGMHERFEHMMGWPSFPTDVYDTDHDYDYGSPVDEDLLHPVENLIYNEQKLRVVDDLTNIRQKLDAVDPICTTITDSPTTISPRKSRRKKLPTTQTTTCIRELIVNGQKHISEEVNTTDDKGAVIKQSKGYGIISVGADQKPQ
jgi:hypothetical protein